jgi:hypothetical protein
MLKINTDEIKIPMWATPAHKIIKSFKDGELHAVNHWFNEEPEPDWPYGVKSWAVCPYSDCRPDAYYSWMAGFSAKWGELARGERNEKNHK